MLKGLVEDILDHSKIETGVFEVDETEFLFEELFNDVKSIFELQAQRKKVVLEFLIEGKLQKIKVKSDKQRLKQVLLNLLSNALKFTDKGSIKVSIEINKSPFHQPRIPHQISEFVEGFSDSDDISDEWVRNHLSSSMTQYNFDHH